MEREILEIKGLGRWVLDEEADKFRPIYNNFKNISSDDSLLQEMIETLIVSDLRFSVDEIVYMFRAYRAFGYFKSKEIVSSISYPTRLRRVHGIMHFRFYFAPCPILKYLKRVSIRIDNEVDNSYYNFDAIKEFVKSDEFVKEILSGKYGQFDGGATFLEGSGQMVLERLIDKFIESIPKDERFRNAPRVQGRKLRGL